MSAHAIPFEQLRNTDVGSVGGKNASLGEMISQLSAKGVRVPTGFATTADAYREFLAQDGLDKKINDLLDKLDASIIHLRICVPQMASACVSSASSLSSKSLIFLSNPSCAKNSR